MRCGRFLAIFIFQLTRYCITSAAGRVGPGLARRATRAERPKQGEGCDRISNDRENRALLPPHNDNTHCQGWIDGRQRARLPARNMLFMCVLKANHCARRVRRGERGGKGEGGG